MFIISLKIQNDYTLVYGIRQKGRHYCVLSQILKYLKYFGKHIENEMIFLILKKEQRLNAGVDPTAEHVGSFGTLGEWYSLSPGKFVQVKSSAKHLLI